MRIKYNKTLRISFLLLTIAVISCQKQPEGPPTQQENKKMSDLVVPDGFTFNTAANVDFNIQSKTNDDAAIAYVPFSIYTAPKSEGGRLLLNGVTGANGSFRTTHPLPSGLKTVWLTTDFPGLPDYMRIDISNNQALATLGGTHHTKSLADMVPFKSLTTLLQPMGNSDTRGVPDYLVVPGDVIDPGLLSLVNNNLPEQVDLTTTHPEWILPEKNYDIQLIEDCDVWITFIDEGAGFKNTLGYYTYDINNPPAAKEDIQTIHVIYPNVSKSGFGGGLEPGDKVYLGQFSAGTGIGLVLLANGWDAGTQTVSMGQYQIYSNPGFNPQMGGSNQAYAQQFVMLYDDFRDLVLIGIEDIVRPGGDQDFNDAVFYLTANPVTAIDPDPYPDPEPIEDGDGDGVPDDVDDYPDDPDRAFDVYYPSENTFGTLAYEDLWPSKGDYDFNDMVIDYNVHHVTNADNDVVDVYGTLKLRAMGAHFKNGFGLAFGTTPDKFSNWTVDANGQIPAGAGLENGQSKAVLMLWQNGFDLLPPQGGGATGVNTTKGIAPVGERTITFSLSTTNAIPLAELGIPPYNPFIFINQDRSREVHLRNMPPTDLADPAYFGTYNDASVPASGIYYKTESNLPWAIHLIESFDYPAEKIDINQAYQHFAEWAESGGASYADWYKDLPGYRVDTNIYP